MTVEIFKNEDIVLGAPISVLALCSRVEIKENISTTGSFREVYHINGVKGAYITAVLFKNKFASRINIHEYEEVPVMIVGTIGSYNDILNIVIEKITNIDKQVDVEDFKNQLLDPTTLSDLNDFLYQEQTNTILTSDFLLPSRGLQGGGCGVLVDRLFQMAKICEAAFPHLTKEFATSIATLARIYRYTDNRLYERMFEDMGSYDMLSALLLNPQEYPQYLDFVRVYHTIMKPRGVNIEISDLSFNTTSSYKRLYSES